MVSFTLGSHRRESGIEVGAIKFFGLSPVTVQRKTPRRDELRMTGTVQCKTDVEAPVTFDFPGKGIYFWEYAPKQAWWWASKFKKNRNPAVVGSIIRLGQCLDLLDPVNVAALKAFHDKTLSKWNVAGLEIPRNGNQHKKLDCAIFNLLYDQSDAAIETARAVYVPTQSAKRAWKRSWIYEEAHIQICVRKPENILAVWRVRKDGRYGKDAA